jgi:hypothetical protein
MALGAIQAMEEAGIKPGVDIKIVSIDGVKGAFEAMKDGKLNVTVECNPLLGPQLFDLIEAAAAKKEVPKRVVTQEGVYEQSQAAAELPKRQYSYCKTADATNRCNEAIAGGSIQVCPMSMDDNQDPEDRKAHRQID